MKRTMSNLKRIQRAETKIYVSLLSMLVIFILAVGCMSMSVTWLGIVTLILIYPTFRYFKLALKEYAEAFQEVESKTTK